MKTNVMTIGQYIKSKRLEKGLTQEDLAARTEISARTIQRIENDEVDPRSYTLQNIANILEIDYESLVNFGKESHEIGGSRNDSLWLGLMHLSGLFIFIFPPIIVWFLIKDKVRNSRQHAIDVLNFQISMFIYLICAGFMVFLIIGLPLAILLGIFSTIVILVNSIKVFTNQDYRYPLTLKILPKERAAAYK